MGTNTVVEKMTCETLVGNSVADGSGKLMVRAWVVWWSWEKTAL